MADSSKTEKATPKKRRDERKKGNVFFSNDAVSIAVLLVTILVIAQIAIKIYSNAILNYGTKMNFKDIVKLYKDKNN